MAQKAFPFVGGNNAVNTAEWQKLARSWLSTGVLTGRLNQLLVSADGSALSVSVATGQAQVEGFFYENDSALALAIATANATNPRIDTVVVRLDRAAGTVVLAVVTGTPAASPVAPTLSQTDLLYELPLANVAVPAAAGVIVAANVTDRRVLTKNLTEVAASAAYQALAGEVLYVSAVEMAATFGAPTLAGIGSAGDKSHVAWLLDAAAAENLTGQVRIPAGWATVDIALWWTNAGTGTGDVKYHLITHNVANAATLGTGSVATSPAASSAPAQFVAKLDLLAAGLAATPGRSFGFRLQRDGGNAADSLGNDCGVLALEIRRAS